MVTPWSHQGIVTAIGKMPGVLTVSAETPKPGLVWVRVTGGTVEALRAALEAVKSAGCKVVLEHRSAIDAPVTETFL